MTNLPFLEMVNGSLPFLEMGMTHLLFLEMVEIHLPLLEMVNGSLLFLETVMNDHPFTLQSLDTTVNKSVVKKMILPLLTP